MYTDIRDFTLPIPLIQENGMTFSGKQKKTSASAPRSVQVSLVTDQQKTQILHALSFKEGRTVEAILRQIRSQGTTISDYALESELQRMEGKRVMLLPDGTWRRK
jgi:hypothetical protein